MQTQLPVTNGTNGILAVSPFRELGAYEAIWDQKGTTFKQVADMFRDKPNALPSDFVQADKADEYGRGALKILEEGGVTDFGVHVHGSGEYPQKLRDAAHPVEFLYYQGWWDLVAAPSIAVVGTRKPSREGIARATQIVRHLVDDQFVVVSGLAAGIDTAAHSAALEFGGLTFAVIGTPLSETYPRENADLQKKIADDFLLISQIPVCRYSKQGYKVNRLFFPERNITMSALTMGTIIIEAGETSGTLIQARAALNQGRKLFILNSCFENPNLTWPQKYLDQGAIRVKEYDDIRAHLDLPNTIED